MSTWKDYKRKPRTVRARYVETIEEAKALGYGAIAVNNVPFYLVDCASLPHFADAGEVAMGKEMFESEYEVG